VIRRLITWFVAWSFRRGVSETDMRGALERAFPHRNVNWRTEIVEDAQQRNRARTMREIGA